MARLTPIHYRKFEAFLLYIGCKFSRQKGDHRIYHREGLIRPLVIPADADIPVFIIRNNLRTLGMSVEEYLSILETI
ncbi:MAG TPA: type II toxin-antitoxin system HicA family toxin [Planctomycetota bacterium]|nr:type II toxin-antitoxin system HicA family toxin [Planctomycetota bacterium]